MLPFFEQETRFVLHELSEAQRYLAAQGAKAVAEAALRNPDRSWGSKLKRINVGLPEAGKPAYVPESAHNHSLVEVMNQCATLERLIDTFESISSHFPDFTLVERCHPTTSSSKIKNTADNDLVLRDRRDNTLRFEVSDVASEKDGNGKEQKDLTSLGVLTKAKNIIDRTKIQHWPEGRLFLVVSSEFAKRLLKPGRRSIWLKENHCHYVLASAIGKTRIIEICSGASPQHG